MYALFSPEGKLYRFCAKIAASLYLNLLWTVCSLPIFTIGAATTALYRVCQELAQREDPSIAQSYFRSFRRNIRQATGIWLILLALGVIMAVDGYILWHLRSQGVLWTVLLAILFVALAAYAVVSLWVFPLLAAFDNTTFAMLRNALMIGMRFLLCTAAMAAVYFAMAVVIIRFFTPAILLGIGSCAMICTWLNNNILKQCAAKTQEGTDGLESVSAP